MTSLLHHPARPWAEGIALGLLVAFPLLMLRIDEPFYTVLASRILIFALAATSLNLLVGFGGMVCFGQAAFFGTGAYVVGIAMHHGVTAAWITWPLAVGVSALVAAVIGALSLRTRGVYFIMITLAFAQMIYYLFVSLKAYGGDDGLPLMQRSDLPFGLDATVDEVLYYAVLLIVVLCLLAVRRLVNSSFGRALQAIRENESRAEAIGFPVFRIKLMSFIISGAMAGLAGALVANQTQLASPALLQWHQSGMLLIMVLLGGVGYVYGGVLGAAILLLLEETLSSHTIYWQLGLGLALLAVVLFARNGLLSLWNRARA
ncbi:MAG: branched-chain amino acid ABC transporter permease [Betaproteobacteria bacterium]|nr:branched-chain amino acid ABC transporter permease [Betaproteobacteria bacterium]